jgi:hypothetical protein
MRRSEPGRPGGANDPEPRLAAGKRDRAAVGRPSGLRVGRSGGQDAHQPRGRGRVERYLTLEPVDSRSRRGHEAAIRRHGGIPQVPPGLGGHEPLAGEVGVGSQQADLLLVGAASALSSRSRRCPNHAVAAVARATVSRPLPSAPARKRYGIWSSGPGGGGWISPIDSIVATCLPSGRICVTSTGPPLCGSGPASRRPDPSSTCALFPYDTPSREPSAVADSHAYTGPPAVASWVICIRPDPSAATRHRFGKQRKTIESAPAGPASAAAVRAKTVATRTARPACDTSRQ